VLAAACGRNGSGPIRDGLFVIAQLIQHCCMFDEDRLEGWFVAGDLMSQDFDVPGTEELSELKL
jgi:hypothetical protein